MDGNKRGTAAALTFAVVATLLGAQPASAADVSTIQRIKGTVGFAATNDGKHNDVVTSAGMPDIAEAFSDCSSLAAVTLADGAVITLGGKSDFITPPAAGGPGNLKFGALQFDLSGRPPLPLVIATQYGTVFVAHGSGYVVAGSTGVQTVVRSGEKNDVMFVANNVVSVVPTGRSLVAGASGKPQIMENSVVNSSALYQFHDGRNPLGSSDESVPNDPASSPSSECNGLVAAAGAGGSAALIAGLLGAGAIAVAVGHGGGGGGGGSTPTPAATQAPSATPVATGTPTTAPSPTATPASTSTPTPASSATATPVATATATPVSTPTPVATPTVAPALGPVILNPNSILLSPGVGAPATATFTASQENYTGPFTVRQPSCPLGLLGTPTSSISGNTITVTLPAQAAALSILCSVDVQGGGGKSASEPLDILITALGGPTPTPSPTNSAFGPVIANPASVLLNPGIGQSASVPIAVTQQGYTGPFTVVLNGCLGLGAPPSATVNGGTVLFTLPAQTVAVDLGCSATITGGGGRSATVPITISVAAIGTPTPQPTSSGNAGAGPLTASPASILLDPSAGAAATQNIIVSPSAEGPFTATTTCAIPLGSATLTSVTGNVVTVTAPAQVITAPVGCDTVIVSTTTGNSVTVPVLVTATAVGPAQPTPSPNPVGHGPLFTIPSSILINPGITTDAVQNIEIFDHGFNGTYAVGIAPGCLALQQPVAKLSQSNVATVTVPGQLINAALLCNVTISDGTSTVNVPVTISATALAGLIAKPRFDGLAFRPPVLAFDRAGSSQTIDVIGEHGPYIATSRCPAGTALDAVIAGDRATIRATEIAGGATCMVTISGASGTFGQVPVRVGSGSPVVRVEPLPGRFEPIAESRALALRTGERRELPLTGNGPYTVSDGCAHIADTSLEGTLLHVTGRSAGSCSVTVRSANGATQIYFLVVREGSAGRIGGGLRPGAPVVLPHR